MLDRVPARKGSPRRRSTYHHGDLRDALLDVAERTLDRHGTPSLALRAIARAAGVSHTAAYHHFADRQSLLRAVATRGYDRLREALAGAARAAGPRGFLEMGVSYVHFAAEHPALFRLMFGPEVAGGRSQDAALRAASDAAFQVLLEGARGLEPRAAEAVVQQRAVAAWSIVHGLAGLLLDDQLSIVGLSLRDHDAIARAVLGGSELA
jgi:AcrR family transcriptional regulator